MPPSRLLPIILCWLLAAPSLTWAQASRETATYKRIKAGLDATPAIDTHDHLWPFDKLPGYVETEHGKGMNLAGLWHNSYYRWTHPLTPWKSGMKFDDWWAQAKNDFSNARATSFYRYQLPAFQDLYGIDFDRITDEQARKLNDQIYRNYLDQRWLYEVVTEKANIELLLNDPYWARYEFKQDYPFAVLVLNVTPLVRGFHPSEFPKTADDPYHFAKQRGLKVESLDDYVAALDRLFREAREKGAVCLKSTLAYQRTLHFENVPRERAARHFGKAKSELTAEQVKEFEDFVMWRLAELSARHGLPFQIHTGQARIQGSNPMLLVDLIEANPKTKFILFHGGYPWVGESAVIAQRHKNVWLDSCWLPTLSYSTARRAYHEWLDAIPSNKILWGADCNHAEGIYGATEFTRRCLAEVLAEKVDRGDLIEKHALRVGRRILRDNALELFPQLKDRLWKGKSKLTPPPAGKVKPDGEDRFAGFPPIGKHRLGERSMKVITSDAITGGVRPKWTRAMGDLGGWPAMFRFKGTIYLVFPHVDGHRGKRFEGTGKLLCYTSIDEGKTWTEQPTPPQAPEQGTPEYVVAGDKLYSYEFDPKRQMLVRVSGDGKTWSEPQPVYKPPFYFWGAMYDPVSKQFWTPPHAIPSVKADPARRIDLITSQDGIKWEFVSTVAPFNNASESVLRFEEDRTMVVLIRRKYDQNHSVAVAKPPYKEWQVEDRPGIVEGEHFFTIGGQTFLGSRANYTGDNPDVKANPKLFDGRRSYCTIYRFTKERKLEPWAVVDSMGDCSYPFLVETPTEILCAYYSQHQDRVCKCYLAGFDKAEFLKGK